MTSDFVALPFERWIPVSKMPETLKTWVGEQLGTDKPDVPHVLAISSSAFILVFDGWFNIVPAPPP